MYFNFSGTMLNKVINVALICILIGLSSLLHLHLHLATKEFLFPLQDLSRCSSLLYFYLVVCCLLFSWEQISFNQDFSASNSIPSPPYRFAPSEVALCQLGWTHSPGDVAFVWIYSIQGVGRRWDRWKSGCFGAFIFCFFILPFFFPVFSTLTVKSVCLVHIQFLGHLSSANIAIIVILNLRNCL